jgi:hypothetical protein
MNVPTTIATTAAAVATATETTTAAQTKLPSLSEWSVQHIKDIFESDSDEDSLRSVSATFSDDVTATMNGAPLPREGINELVLAMRKSSKTGLLVEWRQTVEVARDPGTNRVSPKFKDPTVCEIVADGPLVKDGSLSGYYVIRGLWKQLPGLDEEAEFERHKTVTVSYVPSIPVCFSPRLYNQALGGACLFYRIESQSPCTDVDSRRIVSLAFQASDVKVEHCQDSRKEGDRA